MSVAAIDEDRVATSSRSSRAIMLCSSIVALVMGACAAWGALSGNGGTALSRVSEGLLLGGFALVMFATAAFLWAEYRFALIVYAIRGSRLIVRDGVSTTEVDLAAVNDYHVRTLYSLRLSDVHGRAATVYLGHIHDPAREFSHTLQAQLRHVRERHLAAMDGEPRSFRPADSIALPLMVLSALLVLVALCLAFDNSRPDELEGRIAILLILALVTTVSLGATWLVRKICLVMGPDHIELRTPFNSRSLAWGEIQSVQNRKMTSQHRRIDHTTLVGASSSMSFNEAMKDYDLAREHAERKVAAAARDRGAQQVAVEVSKKRKYAPYATALLLALVLGMCGFVSQVAKSRVWEQEQLDRHGIGGAARVDRIERTGNERAPYRISYSFVDGSTVFHGKSWAGTEVKSRLEMGARIPIVYLRNEPDVSRYRDGMDWERARVAQRMSYLTIGNTLLAAALLLWVRVHGLKRTRIATTAADGYTHTGQGSEGI